MTETRLAMAESFLIFVNCDMNSPVVGRQAAECWGTCLFVEKFFHPLQTQAIHEVDKCCVLCSKTAGLRLAFTEEQRTLPWTKDR